MNIFFKVSSDVKEAIWQDITDSLEASDYEPSNYGKEPAQQILGIAKHCNFKTDEKGLTNFYQGLDLPIYPNEIEKLISSDSPMLLTRYFKLCAQITLEKV